MPDLSTRTPRPADQVVDLLHPYEVRTGEHTAAAAREIAELVRYLNVATLDDSAAALPDPNTAAAVIGALHTACTRLPQLLNQLQRRMHDFAGDPALSTGSSTDAPELLVVRAAAHLDLAVSPLGQFAGELQAAAAAADRLYLDTDDE